MFHTKVSVGANEIFITPPAPPIIFYVFVSFSAYLAILVFPFPEWRGVFS